MPEHWNTLKLSPFIFYYHSYKFKHMGSYLNLGSFWVTQTVREPLQESPKHNSKTLRLNPPDKPQGLNPSALNPEPLEAPKPKPAQQLEQCRVFGFLS